MPGYCRADPVGGGHHVAGIATWLRAGTRRCNHRREPAPGRGASMPRHWEADRRYRWRRSIAFVDSTAVDRAGALPASHRFQLVDCVLKSRTGRSVQNAGISVGRRHPAEPAGALASTAARLGDGSADPQALLGPLRQLAIIVRRVGRDLTRYAEVMERSLRHEGPRHYHRDVHGDRACCTVPGRMYWDRGRYHCTSVHEEERPRTRSRPRKVSI